MLLCLSKTWIRKIPGIPTMGFQVFFSEMEEDFIKGLKKGITFFTWWGGEESDVVFTTIFHFDTFSFILSTTIP